MVSILPLISNSNRLFSRPLEIIPRAPTSIGITVTFMFHNFYITLIIIIIIIILLIGEFFTPAVADGLPQEFEWQQASSSLQDSS